MKNILVTGASGFIGSALLDRLLTEDLNPIGLARGIRQPTTEIVHDVRDTTFLIDVIQRHEIDTIYHLAACTQVEVGNTFPYAAADINIMGTLAVLEAARLCKVARVIIASSDKAYGSIPGPCREDTPLLGRNPYDATKVSADVLGQMYLHAYGLPVAITRCANVYGPGDTNWRRLIPGAIRAAVKQETFKVRSNGKMTRDYVYIDDVVEFYYQLGVQGSIGPYNCAGDDNYSVLEVLEKIKNHIDLDFEVMATANNEIKNQQIDASKALENLGWAANCDFDEGIQETIDWFAEYIE